MTTQPSRRLQRGRLGCTRREFLQSSGAWLGCLPLLLEDVDLSGRVDSRDVRLVRAALRDGRYSAELDVNQDGQLDQADLEQVRSRRGERVVRYAAHYYPWWGNRLQPPYHWGEGISYRPARGFYDTSAFRLAYDQIQSACRYGLDTFLVEWIGPASDFGRSNPARSVELALQQGFLPALEAAGGAARFAILYDSAIIFRREFGFQPDRFDFDRPAARDRLVSDLIYLGERYFGHPQYLHLDGRPLVYLYLTRSFRGDYAAAFDRIQAHFGGRIFLLGDEVWLGGETDLSRSGCLDAVTAYHLYRPDLLEPLGFAYGAYTDLAESIYRSWRRALEPLRHRTSGQPVRLVPSVIPDFNDFGLLDRSGRERNRPLLFGANPAAEFGQQIERMKRWVDPKLALMVVTSYNEFHEGTTVEETVEYGFSRLIALAAHKAFNR